MNVFLPGSPSGVRGVARITGLPSTKVDTSVSSRSSYSYVDLDNLQQ